MPLATDAAIRASGRILNHGAGLADVGFEVAGMVVISAAYVALGGMLFARRHCQAR